MTEAKLPYHRKYRPKSLKEFVGSTREKKAVKSMTGSDVRPQVIMLKGFSGTGKTSMARLIAKEYLCEDNGEGACGKCEKCREMERYIETGDCSSLISLREVDATDNNKKQDIEDLLEDASMPSFDGDWKIYIIDECHMMTISAQNRLLKTLEEPPEKVLVVLCTTDPLKMLVTVLSRCQYTLHIQKPDKTEMQRLLQRVCKREGVDSERRAFDVISARGGFKPREVLMLLEMIVREEGAVTYEKTVKALNLVADKYYFEFFERLRAGDTDSEGYVRYIYKVKEAMELEVFVENIITFLTRGVYTSCGVKVDAIDDMEIEQYKSMVKQFSHMEITYIMDKLLEIKERPDVLEMQLMLLGYRGLRGSIRLFVEKEVEKAVLKGKKDTKQIDATGYSPGNESIEGLKAQRERMQKEKEEKEGERPEIPETLNAENIAAIFGGKIVKDCDTPIKVLETDTDWEPPAIEFE